MLGLAIILCLSILLTGFAFVFSHMMIKLFKINHPKNRFWIYLITMISAFSIFLFPYIVISDTSDIGNQISNPVITGEGEYTPILTIVKENINLENNTVSSVEKVVFSSEITNYSTYNENIYYNISSFTTTDYNFLGDDIATSRYSGTTNSNFYQYNGSAMASSQLSQYHSGWMPPEMIAGHWIEYLTANPETIQEEHASTSGIIRTTADDHFNGITSEHISIFLAFNLLLLTIGAIYLGLNFAFGKRYTLKNINAKKCQDPEIIHMIKGLSEELNIKMPKIFVFDGNPNAFVSGYPVSLSISKGLISCLSKEELRMAMRHELAHIKNKDIFIKPLLQALRILFFYNPVVHILYYKMIRERELMADSLFINSKAEKVTFMEALVKIHDYTRRYRSSPQTVYGAYSLPLVLHNPKKLEMKDRFSHLFGNSAKKTFYSMLICLIILLSNVSLIVVAQNVLFTSTKSGNGQEIGISITNQETTHYYNHPIEYIYIFKDSSGTYNECIIQIIQYSYSYPQKQYEVF